jgi:hypothetical protein
MHARLVLLIVVGSGIVAGIAAAPALALSPSVETLPAAPVGETGATIKGKVNPNGLETKFFFEYGTSTSYGSKTAETSAGSGSGTLEKGQPISGLNKNTIYHYRIVATNSSGTSYGTDLSFRTVGAPVAFTSGAEPHASGVGATLNAWINPNGQETTYQFEYGTKPGTYTTKVPAVPQPVGSGVIIKPVSYTATGLAPGTKYFYRAAATNASGKVNGNEMSFWSSKVPGVSIQPASDVRRFKATLSGTVEPHELATKYYFEYGLTTSYGGKTAIKEISGESISVPVAQIVYLGIAKKLFHYRLVAENSAGKVTSGDGTFTTLGLANLSVKGEGLGYGDPLKASSFNLTIAGRPCAEANFDGEAKETPASLQRVVSVHLQSGAAGCSFGELNVKYIRGFQKEEDSAFEYGTNEAGKIVVNTTHEFRLLGTSYLGGSKMAECEYNLALSGTAESGKSLEPTLTGKMEMIKGNSFFCPWTEAVSGKFAITSEGAPVEANPWP